MSPSSNTERVKAGALVLVNWKGVFFEHYALDPCVTALEGANGAGKTTVMIAAYLVLFPDLSRLRFSNIGESGATGGDRGIWGRLGDQSRPSYAAIEYFCKGERVIAAVAINRKAEPVVELQPFFIEGLGDEEKLSDLFLIRGETEDSIPHFDELKALVQARELKLYRCSSVKDYFAKLFERGISPLRLASDEERHKYNELLRTSMTGGISRALSSELRNFVLKQESGLGDTLGRMRGNLDTCHRTRVEVSESRSLEFEISGICEAGSGMFSAASKAIRERTQELSLRLDKSQSDWEYSEQQYLEIKNAKQKLEGSAGSLDARSAVAKQQLANVEAELLRRERLKEFEGKRQEINLVLVERLAHKESVQLEVEQKRIMVEHKQKEVLLLRQEVEKSASGLAHLQIGLEELHRGVQAYRRAETSRQAVMAKVPNWNGELDSLPVVKAIFENELNKIDGERTHQARELSTSELRRKEFQEIAAAYKLFRENEALEANYDNVKRSLQCFAETKFEVEKIPEQQRLLKQMRAERDAQLRFFEALSLLGISAEEEHWLDELYKRLRKLGEELRENRRLYEENSQQLLKDRDGIQRSRLKIAELEKVAQEWTRLGAAAIRLEAVFGELPRQQAEFFSLIEELEAAVIQVKGAVADAVKERELLSQRQRDLSSGGGQFSLELIEVRDNLGGELLAARFEDLAPEEAARLQASLGPAADAIVVPDLEAALIKLKKSPDRTGDVYLIEEGASLDLGMAEDVFGEEGSMIVVPGKLATRISNVPEQARFGRRAREREIEYAALRLVELDAMIENLSSREQQLAEQRKDLMLLSNRFKEWVEGDPAVLRAKMSLELDEKELSLLSCQEKQSQLRLVIDEKQGLIERCQEMVQRGELLGALVENESLENLERQIAQAEKSQNWVSSAQCYYETLSSSLALLKQPLPSEDELNEWRDNAKALDESRDSHFEILSLMKELLENPLALNYRDAEATLSKQSGLIPDLEAAYQMNLAKLKQTEIEFVEEQERLEKSKLSFLDAHAAFVAMDERLKQLLSESEAANDKNHENDPLTELADHELKRECEHLRVKAVSIEEEYRVSAANLAVSEVRREQAESLVVAAKLQLENDRRELVPAKELLRHYEERLSLAGLSGTESLESEQRGSLNWWPLARARAQLLIDRLSTARGGIELGKKIQRDLDSLENSSAERYLDAWIDVLGWLRKRLPPHVADVPQPTEALGRLKSDLGRLESRLLRQEDELRGASEDVARGIEVQIRRCTAQIRRLNQHLHGLAFGNVQAIRIDVERVERMEAVLKAMRDGQAQELLFEPNLPIEEALEELLRRYGGGRGGGQKVLDYREYIELRVKIQRKGANDWEPANAARLSTGESIGVGAALMIVVLTEWERDSQLLRKPQPWASLRFLFLDEANRLSQDNLGVLFSLCESLSLQLLIAAPEVAVGESNTTYRLIRTTDERGKEEVLVSGRRKLRLVQTEAESGGL